MDLERESLTLEHRLCSFANEINKSIGELNGSLSACSIYLYDYRRDKFVLRASTEPTTYLGKDELETSEMVKKRFDAGEIENLGITVTAIMDRKTTISTKGDIKKDARFSRFKCKVFEAEEWEENHFCEFSLNYVGSVIACPITFKPDEEVGGVVRVVRYKKGREIIYFNDNDKKNLQELVETNVAWIQSGVFISQLIELGTYMDLQHMCTKAAEVLRNLLNCKGCSIFLLDENDSNKMKKIYKCFGTTGLVKRQNNNEPPKLINDPLNDQDAWYYFEPEDLPANDPELPLTVGVIRARSCAFVNDIYNQKDIRKQFARKWKVRRKKGIGKICEQFTTDDNRYLRSESILYAPMYFCDPNDQFIDVLGVVRVVRPKEDNKKHNQFTRDQIHLFVSLVERLSKAVMTAKLIHFFDGLAQIADQNSLLEYVVSNIPKYIGATDCAILLVKNNKLVKWASWYQGEVELSNEDTFSYDLNDPHETGYTYFVAKTKKALMFNGKEDLENQYPNAKDRPKHKDKNGKTPPYRFLGVPVLDMVGNLLAVVRICKSETATRLTREDRRMLERICAYLQSRIELFRQREKVIGELNKRIPLELQQRIEDIENVTCRYILQEFLKRCQSGEAVEDAIIDFIPKLWEFYRPTFGDRAVTILKRFKLFNAQILSEIPHYRDHFIHQLIVFLLGIGIMDRLNYATIFEKAYLGEMSNPSNTKVPNNQSGKVETAWFLTALFHDVAYPLQTVNKWLWNILDIFIADTTTKENKNILLDGILFNPEYIDQIDNLSNFHLKTLHRDEPNIRRTIMKVLNQQEPSSAGLDHGIMGALMLLSDKRFELMDVLPSASAIALHNKLCEQAEVDDIRFENHPLAFLLIYCDLLHEWGRSSQYSNSSMAEHYPRLVKFVIADSWKQLTKVEQTLVSLVPGNKIIKNCPCVFAEIHINNYIGEKIEEARDKFDKLKSNSVNFLMKIDREVFVSRPFVKAPASF